MATADPQDVRAWRGTFDDDPPSSAGPRLDRWLAERIGRPRNKVQRWIKDGHVTVGGRSAKPSTELQPGDEVVCTPPVETEERLAPETGDLDVLFEDEHLVVLDKPAEMAVHPGAGRSTGTLAHRLLHHYPETAGVGGPGRPGIVHRLDLDTTGVLVVARTEAAYLGLTEAFAARRVDKIYLAVVHGVPDGAGTIEAPIGRHPQDRKRMAIRPRGKPAVSHYRRLATAEGVAAVVAVDLETGRTHQIRVHLKAIGHPLVGDPVYGEARWKGQPKRIQTALRTFQRPALHAWRLAFDHPIPGARTDRVDCTAPVPDDLTDLWRKLSGSDAIPTPEP